ncbi:hypothetical protein [Burkholderia sp. BCC0405]|uniref:hypothetical protein n=1 Tax=Burkholderia sp. BCC0405 TaxID=2676298 RepID=UPI00158EDCCC|nr:hypothetical protein [Burkholderia sp. BCC0405]
MRKIGFHGGSSLCELGPASDVVLFFACIDQYVAQEHPETDWSLITDRLYRRYLPREDLARATDLMVRVREIFAQRPAASSIEWDAAMLEDRERSWLNPDLPTLADVFSKYFENFSYCVESAKVFEENWKIYKPVRTVISDLSGFARDKNKPLAEYDAIKGKPFWLQ